MAELHSIRLFGNPCPIKKPTHNIKSRRFSPTAMVFKRIFISAGCLYHLFLFLQAHSIPFSQQVLTRIIIILSQLKSMISGLSYAVSTLFWRFLHKKIRFFEISLLFENKTNFVFWECFRIMKNAFKYGSWKFNNCTWTYLVAYLHEYEIFRDDEVVKRHLFLSLDTILMIIETCAHSSAL